MIEYRSQPFPVPFRDLTKVSNLSLSFKVEQYFDGKWSRKNQNNIGKYECISKHDDGIPFECTQMNIATCQTNKGSENLSKELTKVDKKQGQDEERTKFINECQYNLKARMEQKNVDTMLSSLNDFKKVANDFFKTSCAGRFERLKRSKNDMDLQSFCEECRLESRA